MADQFTGVKEEDPSLYCRLPRAHLRLGSVPKTESLGSDQPFPTASPGDSTQYLGT